MKKKKKKMMMMMMMMMMMKETNFVLFICRCGRNWRVGRGIQLAEKGRLENLKMDGRIILKRS